MTEEQKTKLSSSEINKALVFAYQSLLKFLADTGNSADLQTIHFESIKENTEKSGLWDVVFSYKQTHGENTNSKVTAFDAIYGNKKVYQKFIVNPEREEVISVESIE